MKLKLRYCWRAKDWVLRRQDNTGPCQCIECVDAREVQADVSVITACWLSFAWL
jgi:hypothetical protein